MIFRKLCAQFRGDALRQENRNTRPDPEKLDVLYRSQPRKQFLDLIVGEDERVATAQQHITHFSVLFEIMECFFKIGVQFLFTDPAHDAAPRAIPAVAGAPIRHQKQNSIRIAMNQARNGHMRIFTAWVSHVVWGRPTLFDARNDLAPDRIVRIIARN